MSAPESPPVVVGFDGSERAGKAVAWAAQTASTLDVPLVVLHADHVQMIPDSGIGLWRPEDLRSAAQAVAERGAELARAAVPGLEVTAEAAIASGAAALEDRSAGASLVVVGNSGHGRVTGILLGSTAFHVATHSKCPVAVVPPGDLPLPGPAQKVCVATDGSPSGRTAVLRAADIAARYGAPLQIITAWQRPPRDRYVTRPTPGLESAADLEEALRGAADRVLEDAEQQALAAHPDLTVTTLKSEGRPAHVIARETAGAAILVVGARGHGDLRSLLLGSTSRAVLHLATCPVEVVR